MTKAFPRGARANKLNRMTANGNTPPADASQAGRLPGARSALILLLFINGFNYIEDPYTFLKNGGDTLDAALRVVKGPEDDPKDTSVGLGGLPNEEGVVELDSCCMHGPTRRAGSVGGMRNIKNVSLVAKAVPPPAAQRKAARKRTDPVGFGWGWRGWR